MPITTEPSATADGEHTFAFGPFRLLAAQRLLLEGDTPVRLGSRAFDILAALVERSGEVVAKQELIARAWPQTFAMSLCYALALAASPIALWTGNLTAAAHYTSMLVDQSSLHGLSLLSTFASRFQKSCRTQGWRSRHRIAAAAYQP